MTGAADDAELAAVKALGYQNAQTGSSAGQTSGGILAMAQALWGQFQSIQGLYNTLTQEQKDLVLDLVGLAFDIGGIFEPTPTLDVLSTALSGARGDYVGAFASFLGVIPYVGDAAKLTKIPRYLDRATTALRVASKAPTTAFATVVRKIMPSVCGFLGDLPLNRLPEGLQKRAQSFVDQATAWLGGCFAAGTPLLIPGGEKPIEEFKAGDWVLSAPEDDPTAIPVPRVVEEVFANFMPLMELRFGNVKVQTTIEHPFWVEGRGWTHANMLVEGDRLRSHDGSTVVLTGIECELEAAPVYNMQIAEYHTYFVGSAVWGFSIWSHNAGACKGGAATARSGRPAENAVSGSTGIPLNNKAPKDSIPGTGPGGVRYPDLKVFGEVGSITLRGSVIEVKDVARLEARGQIRNLIAYAKRNKLTLEIFTDAPSPKSGAIFEGIKAGIVKLVPIPWPIP